MKKLTILKLLISTSILYFVFTKIDLESSKLFLSSAAGVKALVILSILMLLQNIFSGVRLGIMTKVYGYKINFLKNFGLCMMGTFFSQAMITFVGGDAMKIWGLSNSGVLLGKATSIVFLDRIVGLLVLLVMLLLALPALLQLGDPQLVFNLLIVVSILAAMCGALLLIFRLKLFAALVKHRFFNFIFDAVTAAKQVCKVPINALIVIICSFAIHFLCVLAVFVAANLYDVKVSLYWCYAIGIPALVVSMLPISIAGWGVRESVLMLGFSLLGLPQEKGVAVSVLWGLALIIGSLPGIIVFLFEKKRPAVIPAVSYFS